TRRCASIPTVRSSRPHTWPGDAQRKYQGGSQAIGNSLHGPQFGCRERRRVLVGETAELAEVVLHLLADELGLGLRGSDARPLVIGLVGELVNGAVDSALAAHADKLDNLLDVELGLPGRVKAVAEPVASSLHRLCRPELEPNGLRTAQRLH